MTQFGINEKLRLQFDKKMIFTWKKPKEDSLHYFEINGF